MQIFHFHNHSQIESNHKSAPQSLCAQQSKTKIRWDWIWLTVINCKRVVEEEGGEILLCNIITSSHKNDCYGAVGHLFLIKVWPKSKHKETEWILIYTVHFVNDFGMLIVWKVVLLLLLYSIVYRTFVSRFGQAEYWLSLGASATARIMFDLSQIGKVFGNNEYHPFGIIMQASLWCW